MWPNANFIRYTMAHDLKEAGSIQFTRLIEVGLTRDGESLAGAATTSERPKCIVTGGAATMTMSYQGRTFPICCTGCRDEFNENPEKYIKKASLMAASQAGKAEIRSAGAHPRGPVRGCVRRRRRRTTCHIRTAGDRQRDQNDDEGRSGREIRSREFQTRRPPRRPPAPMTARPSPERPPARRRCSSWDRTSKKPATRLPALGYYRQIVKDFANNPGRQDRRRTHQGDRQRLARTRYSSDIVVCFCHPLFMARGASYDAPVALVDVLIVSSSSSVPFMRLGLLPWPESVYPARSGSSRSPSRCGPSRG